MLNSEVWGCQNSGIAHCRNLYSSRKETNICAINIPLLFLYTSAKCLQVAAFTNSVLSDVGYSCSFYLSHYNSADFLGRILFSLLDILYKDYNILYYYL